MGKREYTGAAQALELSVAIGPTDLNFDVVQINGEWPEGDINGLLPFYITVDRGETNEEKMLVSHRTGNTFFVAGGGRGADDTTAAEHQASATVEHVWTATDARESNGHVNADKGVHGLTASDRVVGAAEFTAGQALKVNKAGDTMTGPLVLAGPGADPLNPATKAQLDTEVADRIADVDAEEAARIAAVSAEATARQNADTTLQGNINTEASTRAAADTTLQGNIDTVAADLATETTNRTDADAAHVAAADPHVKYARDEGTYVKAWQRSMTFNASGAAAFAHGQPNAPIAIAVNAELGASRVTVHPGATDSTNINVKAFISDSSVYVGSLSQVHILAVFPSRRPT